MKERDLLVARKEVFKTLGPCNFCTRKIGITFIDEVSTFDRIRMTIWCFFSLTCLALLVVCEIGYDLNVLVGSNRSVAEFVANLHIVGYGIMGIIKSLTIWYKRNVFRQLVEDLVEIWPVSVDDKKAAEIKRSSLAALKFVQFWYVFCSIFGNMSFNVTPIILHVSRLVQGQPSELGFIWLAVYPFDKTKPVVRELVFVFEFFSALVSVWGMLGTDVIFTTMANHISMMLRLLQVKIKSLTLDNRSERRESVDCYGEITSVIKIHQRLISYTADLENVFSMVNLTNVVLCAVNICCVAFNIVVIEPWMVITNKAFLGAVLTQVGIICWYADNIYRASMAVADAVYESGWYKSDVRCRRALLLLLQRSQKPLCFTAFKFSNITMATYSSILTSAYSYFTLLYTIYRD